MTKCPQCKGKMQPYQFYESLRHLATQKCADCGYESKGIIEARRRNGEIVKAQVVITFEEDELKLFNELCRRCAGTGHVVELQILNDLMMLYGLTKSDSTEDPQAALHRRAVATFCSTKSWKDKYTAFFTADNCITTEAKKIGVHIEWEDPDGTEEEDVRAFYLAFRKHMEPDHDRY